MIPNSSKTSRGAILIFLISLALMAVTVAVYWRVGGFSFLNYDDVEIFFKNPMVRGGLTWQGIVWGATTTYYEYWHPLMWWSHMLDCTLFGMNAGPHHLVNLAYHVANTLLVFAIFRRMTGKVWRSAVVAALFGLHPLHVESVAWLAERKDLLSTLFWLLSVWAYARYAEAQRAQEPGRRGFYWWSVFFFLLGLLSKPMVVTLPFVLLLLDYWPLNRMGEGGMRISDIKSQEVRQRLAGLVREKWPFFGLTALFCFVTWYSVVAGEHLPTFAPAPRRVRLANIPISYVRYLWKTAYPRHLAVLYPMPGHWPWWQVGGAILLLAVISWLALRARSARYLAFGWLMFVGILVPTIGIVQVGAQSMADRYMYVPAIGLFAAAVWGVADVSRDWGFRKFFPTAASAIVLAVCAVLSWFQVQSWRDSVSLWTHCLTAGYESVIAHHDLGREFIDRGEMGKAIEQYKAALKLEPDDLYVNLGVGAALIAANQPREATNYIARVLRLDPENLGGHEDMGLALIDLGDVDGAIAQFSEVIRLDPNRPSAYADLGKAYAAQGKSDIAMGCYSTALKLNPDYAAARYYLGLEYVKRGALDEATSSFEQAVQLDPGTLAIRMQLADVYVRRHERGKAIFEYRAALGLSPDAPETLNNLAWLLATAPDASLRNGREAVTLAERACDKTSWRETMVVGTLAAAYAEAGDFEKAVLTAQKACDLATANGEKELLQKNEELLAQYRNRQAFREKE